MPWFSTSISDTNFEHQIAPFLIDNSISFSQDQLVKIFKSVRQPPKSLMNVNTSTKISPFEHFLLRFFESHPSDNFISSYFHLLCYLSIDRFDIFCLPFLRSLNAQQNLKLITKLPDCKSVFIHLMELLYKTEETFLMSFNRLFLSFEKIPTLLIPFFNLCFRKALKKSIFMNNFDVILTIISKLNENSYSAYDFFFSAFISDPSVCDIYINNMKKTFLLQIDTKCNVMPISFLKFLILTKIKCKLTDQIIWSYFQMSPSLTFQFIDCYPETVLCDIWKKLLLKVQNYSSFQDIHINIFYNFMLSSIKHPFLIQLFPTLNLRTVFNDLIFTKKQANSFISYKKIAFLSLYLLFCRLDEKISNDFYSIRNFQSELAILLANKGQFKLFIDYFLWVLDPTNEFPMEEIYSSESNDILLLLPPPSFTFSSKIAPRFVSLLMKIGISDHFDEPSFAKLIDAINKIYKWDRTPHNLLLGIADESVLTSLIPYAMKSDTYFYLLTSALSISCVFPAFSKVYSQISNDDQKLLKFLISISSTSPLVNDFLRIDTKHKFNFSCMNGTIAMWVRFLNQPVQIAIININSNFKIYVKRNVNTFILEVGKGSSKFIPMNDDIGGWFFIVIGIKPKSISMSVNLAKVKIEGQFGQSAIFSLGKKTSIFDLQSFHFFRSELSAANIYRLFVMGPNYKTNFVDNFISINYNDSPFIMKNNYISSLYLQWILNFHSRKLNLMLPDVSEVFSGKNYEFGISPPYGQFITSQKNPKFEKNNSILQKRFYFESFINSLDAHGGIFLIIHFLAEIILKKKELHSLAFSLFDILVNRFPFIHYYFEKNKVYQLIGQLLWKSSPDPNSIFHNAMALHDNRCVIVNIDVVKYWFFGPSLFHCEFYDLILKILTSLEGEFADDNFQILEIADCFNSIIKSISNSKNHSEKFLSILMALALKITNQNNAQKHASIIIKYLLVYHFRNQANESKIANDSQKCEVKNDSNETVSLIHLLSQILFNFGKKVSVSLSSLLPMFLNSPTPVLNSLYDLMMKYLHPSNHTEFIVALSHSKNNPEFSDYVYAYSTSYIFKANENSYQQFYYVTIPILYLLTQENKEELLITILSAAATILDDFADFPLFIFDHLYRFLYKISSMKLISYFFGHEENSNSVQITPFCHFLLKILICALFNQHSCECVKSFIYGFITLDQGQYSIFVISYLFDRLTDYSYERCSSNMQFMSSIVSDLFLSIPFILRDRIVNPPPYIPFLIKNACNFIDFFSTPDIVNSFLFLLSEISYNSSTIALSIVSIVSDCKVIQSLPNFKDIIYMLDSPMMIMNSKQKRVALKFDNSKFVNFIQKVDENDVNLFLTLYCNSVLAQALNAESIFSEQEENDEILLKWREIFTKLNFPGSKIYSNCPVKYKVDDSTVKYQIRRVLLPMNPSLDHQYLAFWETKYSNKELKPTVRLTLKDVFNESLKYSHTNDILFTAESSRLHGTSIIQGFFIVTKRTIKFFMENDLLVFNANKVHSIRLIDYQHRPIGIFINEKDMNSSCISSSAMFAFKTSSLRVDFINSIEKYFQFKIIRSIDNSQLISVTHSWSLGRITNFDYLLYLNFLSGRTWSDLTRYPIFPWVCLDFSKSGPVMRDMRFPFFAQTDEQKQYCVKYYKMTKEIPDELPHYYSNYVSNVGSTLYFLVRLEPFTTEEIEYQGGNLDSPDRSFQSFEIAANVMTHPGEKSTLELIPEAYFMPDFLVNVNGISFPKSPMNGAEISDVKLPSWSTSKFTKEGQRESEKVVSLSPFKFVRKMRMILESDEVSASLHEWIDLIWGARRAGQPAEERLNVFSPIIYEFDEVKYYKDQKLLNAFSSLMHSCGQAPLQLFADFHATRQVGRQRSPQNPFARKRKLVLACRSENKRPHAEDLFSIGFDTRGRSESPEFFSASDRCVIMCDKLFQCFIRMRITQKVDFLSAIEIEKIGFDGKSAKSVLNFASELEPRLLCAPRNGCNCVAQTGGGYGYFFNAQPSSATSFECSGHVDFITSHRIPIVNHFHFLTEKCQIVHVSTLRGHLAEITAIAINSKGALALAGHSDGSVSSFRLDPDSFVRAFECRRRLPVSKVAVLADNSALLVVQNWKMRCFYECESKSKSSFVSLFTPNGQLVAETEIENEDVKECVLTSFCNGVQTDFAFLLTESSKIFAISMNSLKRKADVETGSEIIESISLWNNVALVALTSTNSLISWKLFDLAKK